MPCDYPDDLDAAGRRCGNRAASVRAGGRNPAPKTGQTPTRPINQSLPVQPEKLDPNTPFDHGQHLVDIASDNYDNGLEADFARQAERDGSNYAVGGDTWFHDLEGLIRGSDYDLGQAAYSKILLNRDTPGDTSPPTDDEIGWVRGMSEKPPKGKKNVSLGTAIGQFFGRK